MLIKIYKKYIISTFLIFLVKTSGIFFALVYILNIFDEINYFKDINSNIFYPLLLTFFNTPATVFETFPFIFLIATQFFFIKLIDKNELNIFKNFGLSSFQIIKIMATSAFVIGILIVIVFYTLSAKLKYNYLSLKNSYSDDNKYLAVITKNGLWIKDEIDNKINIINAEKIEENYLINVSIMQFSKEYDFYKSIESEKVNIESNDWIVISPLIFVDNLDISKKDNVIFKTNFNIEKINNLFSNLYSLTLFELYELKKDYEALNYSTDEIRLHGYKVITYPLYLTILTVLSSIIMLNIKHNKSKIFNVIAGILLSVTIYYINYFFGILGNNGKIPMMLSIFLPLTILGIFCVIGLIRINEK